MLKPIAPHPAFSIRHSAFGLDRFRVLLPLVLFLALAVAWTWPVATRLSTRIAHDAGDPVLNAWILWWSTQAVPFTDEWWSPPIFHPLRGALALSEHLFGVAVFTVPLHYAGLNAAAAYNVALIVTCWLSGFFAYLLGRRLTGSLAGAWICGLAFVLAPYRGGQLAHLQVMATQWMPLALLAMHGYVADSRRRWLALFGVAWVLQALSNGYYLLFFPVLIAAWLLWFGTLRQKLTLAATFAVSSILLIPTLLKYREVHAALGLRRNLGEMLMFSAGPESLLQTTELLAFWPATSSPRPEGDLFPGVTAVAIVLAGAGALLWRQGLRRAWAGRSPGLFYALAAVLFWWLSFGPAAGDAPSEILARPYTILTWLPGFSGLRVPARFAMLATLCLAAAAAVAAARVLPRRTAPRALIASLMASGIFVDGWIEPVPLVPIPSRYGLPSVLNPLVLELPLDDLDRAVAAMYRQIDHGRPIVNGYSGHIPPHYDVLAAALRRGDPTALRFLALRRPLVVLVHRAADREGEWRAFVEGIGGVLHEESGLGPVLLVPPQPADTIPPLGDAVPSTPMPPDGEYAAVDLGDAHTVRALSVDLKGRYDDLAPRSLVETSLDGQTWGTAWEGWTGGRAVAALLEEPTGAPLTLTLPDVRARFVRISPAPPWVSEEMRVYRAR